MNRLPAIPNGQGVLLPAATRPRVGGPALIALAAVVLTFGGFGGWSMRAQLDEVALKKVADMTKARYFHATSAEDLKAVYDVLSRQLVVEMREMEITSFFAAMAALLMAIAAGLSLAWFHRVF